jgi:hypothetical protein
VIALLRAAYRYAVALRARLAAQETILDSAAEYDSASQASRKLAQARVYERRRLLDLEAAYARRAHP